jgi:hypothetical protein
LADGVSESYARSVFETAAKKVVSMSISNARVKAVTVYYKTVLKQPMNNKDAKTIHLTRDEYLQSYVDWLCKDMEAWKWLCTRWASQEFLEISQRNRLNRRSKPGLHTYGADGHIGKARRMVCVVIVNLTLLVS